MPTAETDPSRPADSTTHDEHKKGPKNGKFDPDHFRMTIGEHLEELRSRLVWGLVGFAVALGVCLAFSDRVIALFCEPLLKVLREELQNPQLVVDNVTEGFMVYMTISLICAATLASPWILYQVWQFVAAGLYPHERKYVTRYLPLSIGLLISGMVFVYLVVLPLTLSFLIHFSVGIELPGAGAPQVDVAAIVQTQPSGAGVADTTAGRIMVLPGDPATLHDGMIWLDTTQQRLKIFVLGQIRVISFGADELLRPEITLASYINLVVAMLISFGVAFQLPLVVLAIERIGIADVDALRRSRKYVYFVIMIASAVISPGDAITATIAMFVPLIGLYELGIWLCLIGKKPEATPVT